MNKNKILRFTKALYIIAFVSTIIVLFIVYTKNESKIAWRFVIVFLFFLIFFAIYMLIITITNLRKLKWLEIRKMLRNFIVLFVMSAILCFAVNIIFRPSKADFFHVLPSAFSSALGITLFDVIFYNRNDN